MVNFTLRQWGVIAALSAGFIVAAIVVSNDSLPPEAVEVEAFDEIVWCETANAISTWRSILDGSVDGDTLDCAGTRIRLVGIDTPEMPGHCRAGRACTPGDPFAAKAQLQRLAASGVSCRISGEDVYGRALARCRSRAGDLSCAMLASGHAVRRYDRLFCAPLALRG